MAQRVRIELIDDYDGSAADQTVSFAVNGVNYDIDLSTANAAAFQAALAPWVEKARRTGGRKTSLTSNRADTSGTTDTKAIRDWAQANGHEVSNRGRVSKELRDAYQAAH